MKQFSEEKQNLSEVTQRCTLFIISLFIYLFISYLFNMPPTIYESDITLLKTYMQYTQEYFAIT